MDVGVNQAVMVAEGTYATVQKPGPVRQMMKAAMAEVVALAQREGIRVTMEDLDDYVELIDSLNPGGMPSMRQDGLARRPSEVEFFAGTVIRRAEKAGLEVPVNRELYRRIKEMENSWKRRKTEFVFRRSYRWNCKAAMVHMKWTGLIFNVVYALGSQAF